jgi:hypothetical protein
MVCRFFINRENKDGNTVAETMEHVGKSCYMQHMAMLISLLNDNGYI